MSESLQFVNSSINVDTISRYFTFISLMFQIKKIVAKVMYKFNSLVFCV